MMKNSKLKFSEYMQNISRSKSFGKFILIVLIKEIAQSFQNLLRFNDFRLIIVLIVLDQVAILNFQLGLN